jgi:hypothetical protein
LLFACRVEPRADVPAWDHERMTRRDRKSIPKAEELVCLEDETTRIWAAEGARVRHESGESEQPVGVGKSLHP